MKLAEAPLKRSLSLAKRFEPREASALFNDATRLIQFLFLFLTQKNISPAARVHVPSVVAVLIGFANDLYSSRRSIWRVHRKKKKKKKRKKTPILRLVRVRHMRARLRLSSGGNSHTRIVFN